MVGLATSVITATNINRQTSLIALDRADCQESLAAFIRLAWHSVEPAQPYVHGWHIDAICEHLEAITYRRDYNRLLINIPPGTMKSLAVSVFWPAWEWGPCGMPHLRYVCASHSLDKIGTRDSNRMRRLISSDWYRERWPGVVLTRDQNQKTQFENTATGFRVAVAPGSMTGLRGDRVIIDDPHSVESAGSQAQRDSTVEWFREAVPTRLNNPNSSAILVIMQRLHEDDVSGVILEQDLGYDHLMLPMRYDPLRAAPTEIGYEDPRTEPGELLFPERFPEEVVDRLEATMGPFATAGQFQQSPEPRGGGVIKREWWQPWDAAAYPPMDYVLASIDTAYTTKTENDYSAMVVLGVFSGAKAQYATNWQAPGGRLMAHEAAAAMFDTATEVRTRTILGGGDLPRVMLMFAWAQRLELHDLVAEVAKTCRSLKVDNLLIENKASGHSVAQEVRRLYSHEGWGVQLIDPGHLDKLARLYAVQHLFAEGMIHAPDRDWAEQVIQQTSVFPKGKHDDLVDALSMGVAQLRKIGLMTRAPEWAAEAQAGMNHHGAAPPPIYPV